MKTFQKTFQCKMKIRTLSLCIVFILARAVELNSQKSKWEFKTVRRHVDSSSILQSTTVRSRIECVSFCQPIDDKFKEPVYYEKETGQCTCNSETESDETSEDENEPEIEYGIRKQVEIIDRDHEKTTVWPYRHDCASLFEEHFIEDGVYVIHPPGGQVTDTWCDMTNGGWTVIQRRMDGTEDFYRGWNDYVNGFGNRRREYWIGLDTLHRLTKNGSELGVYMEAHPGVKPSSMTAHYSSFTIGDIESNYTLDISGFKGTCGNSFVYQNGQMFSTFEYDNDSREGRHCAVYYTGAWWFDSCHYCNLNGKYYQINEFETRKLTRESGIHWMTCWAYKHSAKYAVMKIRRRQ